MTFTKKKPRTMSHRTRQNEKKYLKSKHIREVIKGKTYHRKISIFIKGIKIERCTESNILSSPGYLSCSISNAKINGR